MLHCHLTGTKKKIIIKTSQVFLAQTLCPTEELQIFWKAPLLHIFIQGNSHKSG